MANNWRLTIDHLEITRGPRSGKAKVKRVIDLQIDGNATEVHKWLRDMALVFEERARQEQLEPFS